MSVARGCLRAATQLVPGVFRNSIPIKPLQFVLGSLLGGGVFQMMFEVLHEFHPQSFVVWVASSYVDFVCYLLSMVQGRIIRSLTLSLCAKITVMLLSFSR
jgi:hypothetical protein